MGLFVSLVGFQNMAVVSPLITLISQEILTKPIEVYFLHTEKTLGNACKIRDYIHSKYNDCKVHLREISDNLQDDRAAQYVLREVMSGFRTERFYFNIAGAMNYQISACVLAIDPSRVTYVYPESEGIRLFNIEDRGIKEMKTKAHTAGHILQIMDFQGIPYKKSKKINQTELSIYKGLLLNKELVSKDCGHCENEIEINNVTFQYVFMSRNEFVFVHVTKPNSLSEQIRNLINIATNRHDFGELMHHKIVVVTSDASVRERLESEANGKVIVIDGVNRPFEHIVKSIRYTEEYIDTEKATNSSNKTLYVALGREIMPTLIALWSHSPKRLCIIYTPHDETIRRYKQAMVKHKRLLPCGEVIFIPTDITGKEILEHKPQDGEEIECNITPGTKAQGVFLSIFAKIHGGTVWSIQQSGQGVIRSILDNQTKDIAQPTLAELLLLKGYEEFEPKIFDALEQEKYQALCSFINLLKTNNNLFRLFPKGDVYYKGWSYRITSINNETPCEAYLQEINRKGFEIAVHMDIWFEELTAWSLYKAGARDIALNYKRQRRNEQNTGFLVATELDVICKYLGKYFVISCKTGKSEDINKEVHNLKGTTSIIGRFAIPLLSYFRHIGGPELRDGVYVFGVDTLCKPEKMKTLLEDAINIKRTTNL